MMRGLLAKTLRETWPIAALFIVALAVVERLMMFVLPQTQQMAGSVLNAMPFVRPMLSALLGMPVRDEISSQMLQAILWVHPVTLSLVWGFAIIFCTRFPAGEIDRGTIDVLLGLPASRRAVFLAETIVGLGSGAAIIGLGSVGYFLGAAALATADRPGDAGIALVMINFLCVYVSVCGVGWLVSALSDRRGRAMAIIFALLLASFLLNFLAQFWPPAQRLAFLSVLHYYQPARVMTATALDGRDIAVLLAVGLGAWIAAGEIIARRSIMTV